MHCCDILARIPKWRESGGLEPCRWHLDPSPVPSRDNRGSPARAQPARPRNQPQESSRIQRCERRETLPFLESAHRSVDLQRGRAFAFWLCEKDNPTEGAPKLEIRERNLESRKRTKPAPKGFGGVRLQQVNPESLRELRPLAKRSRLRPAAAGVPDRVGSAWRQQTSNTESRSCGTEHRTAE